MHSSPAQEVLNNVSTHGLYLTKAVFWGLVVLIENLRKIVAQPDFESHWISNATTPTIPEWPDFEFSHLFKSISF